MIHFEEELSMEENRVARGLERFLKGELSRGDNQEIVRRMLAGKTPDLGADAGTAQPAPTAKYDDAFRKTERSLAATNERIAHERQLAAVQWSGLAGHPPARRLVMVRNDGRLHHWGLLERLLAQWSEAVAAGDATAAVGLAELALAVAERLDPEVYGEERICDFRTQALAALGDARRLAGDFAGARLAFSQARINLGMGTGDLLEEADLLGGLVKLLCDLRDYEKAGRTLERASALYRLIGDHHLDGMTIPAPEGSGIQPAAEGGRRG
jgi:tetratricopeptide (TPR) repeat protein